ncbi:hypothetical protein [Alicyclobacillus shizuokensis]|uniref:hypothetical protein n=1 Tax=Alicyclobacillus shizuokensis TaxID=392014 RepID=UPI0012EDAEBB|nr:hypothetical protein [Alicyclobacillus shizuokensis]
MATFNTGDGRVEIAVVSVAQNKYLIQDGNDIKAFVSGAWTTVGQEPITKAMFDSYGMTDLSVLTDAALRQLNSTSPQLLCWTDETGSPSRTQIITGIPPAKLILPIGDIEVPDGIDSVNLDVTTSGFGKVIIVVSVDGGLTWQSHALGGWTPVDISYLENVGANGMLPDQVNALTADEWAALGVTDKIRFAYYLDQLYSTDTAQVNSLTINERQYTLTPTVSSLDVIYKLLNASNPTFYVSRDDGVTWKEVEPDTLVDLTDLPSGNQIRIKAVLQSGQEIYGYSYSWV